MRFLKVIVFLILGCWPVAAREYEVFGPEGGIAFKISLPEGFNPKTDRCPMVILMHGIFSSKDYNPMPALAKGLAQAGIASIRFDFDGHGQSEGRKQDMTIEKELSDARAIWEYVRALPYVDGIGLLGHSQGGVIASMTAGRLSAEGTPPDGLVLIAPGSVIKEACQAGKFFNARFNPADPPEYIRCWGLYKLGREYLLTTQQLDIFGTASAYDGPVRVIHGTRDSIVPMWCSEKFVETYGDRAGLVVVEGENHTISRKRKEVVASVVQFFKGLGRSCVNSCKRTVNPREDSSDFVAITDVVPDVFRMTGSPVEKVVLQLNTRAKSLLVEEYPLAERDLKREDGNWVLRTTINSVEGAGRFVIGLAADIKILQGKKLLDYIKKYDKKHIQKL